MQLRITTPLSVVIDEEGVQVLSAEDASGRFGIQPHHADFLTSLSVGVVSWESSDGKRHYCAVRGGAFTVTAGQGIAIATREAVAGDDLTALDKTILDRFRGRAGGVCQRHGFAVESHTADRRPSPGRQFRWLIMSKSDDEDPRVTGVRLC